MTLCLFLGPTLPRAEAETLCDAVILPPAAQGDVWRAAERRPTAIGIVDGYFSGAPAVWHKEILWALSEGIRVVGSASMGALRAAELHAFGMEGVGRIFEDFRDGRLEDDDEVAVTHGPAELGYPALSEAMVNIRATLDRAEAEGVLDAEARRALEADAKALHFPERSWKALLDGSARHKIDAAALRPLAEWLGEGRVDRKREDALAMIRAMTDAGRAAPPPPAFRFERTHFWDEMVARSRDRAEIDDLDAAVLEELGLEGPEAVGSLRSRALARLLSGCTVVGSEPSRTAVSAVLTRFREERGLFSRAALDVWMAENGLDSAGLERLIAAEARLEAAAEAAGPALDAAILDELRLSGGYPRLADRAARKRAAIAGAADAQPVEPMTLRLWFFRERLGRAMPEDLPGYAAAAGFASLAAFDNALRRERLYVESPAKTRG